MKKLPDIVMDFEGEAFQILSNLPRSNISVRKEDLLTARRKIDSAIAILELIIEDDIS